MDKKDFSLVKNSSFFDSMLMERLNLQNIDVLKYLRDCFSRALNEKDFELNKNDENNMNFIDFSLEIIGNFCYLVLSTPEIFENQELDIEIKNEIDGKFYIL